MEEIKKSLKCMKKHEAAAVSMEQKKNRREKCQQQIAAGFCCCGRHGLRSFVFLSFHIMRHVFIQLNTNTGHTVEFREHLRTALRGEEQTEEEYRGRRMRGGRESDCLR